MNPGLTRPLKINDKVWSKRFGYGQIIYVTFEDGNTDTYTKQGRRLESGNICLKLIEKEPESLTLEHVEGLGKVFTLSCGTRILKTLENTHIILPQTSNL